MGLESSTFISGLDSANPLATDPKSQGDDHIRLVKSAVKATFPNLTGAVTATHLQINDVASQNLQNCTADGINAVGFRTIPQNSMSAAYTLVLSDSGKHIFHPSTDTTARIFTIPANTTAPFPIGTAVTFINGSAAGVVTISITTDTMRLAGLGNIGNRTLATNGVATAVKVLATEWIISGSGLT